MNRGFSYSKEEFESQYRDYLAQGLSPTQALKRVNSNEEIDRREYEQLEYRANDYSWDDYEE